jgi:hypothetical protein
MTAPETTGTIAKKLRARAAICRADAEKLLAEAAKFEKAASVLEPLASNGRSHSGNVQGTQLDQLTDFLRKNGPLSRAEIASQSGLPSEVYKNWLREKYFHKDEEGRWNVKDPEAPSSKGSTRHARNG